MLKEIYLIHHTHYDIGFTDLPDEVERRQLNYLDEAVRLAEADPAFHWTIESGALLRNYLESISNSRRKHTAVKKRPLSRHNRLHRRRFKNEHSDNAEHSAYRKLPPSKMQGADIFSEPIHDYHVSSPEKSTYQEKPLADSDRKALPCLVAKQKKSNYSANRAQNHVQACLLFKENKASYRNKHGVKSCNKSGNPGT